MLAVFSGSVVIVCEVDGNGSPQNVDDYFAKGAYNKDEFDMTLVEGPVCVDPHVTFDCARRL